MNARIVVAHANATSDPNAHGAVHRCLPRSVPFESRETAGDDGYAKLFRELWLGGRPFIIIEQKIIPAVSQLEQLDACPEPWCGHTINGADHIPDRNVGAVHVLTKYRPSGPVPFEGLPHWEDLASAVYAGLEARGWKIHQHDPPVIRLASLPPNTVQIPGMRNQT